MPYRTTGGAQDFVATSQACSQLASSGLSIHAPSSVSPSDCDGAGAAGRPSQTFRSGGAVRSGAQRAWFARSRCRRRQPLHRADLPQPAPGTVCHRRSGTRPAGDGRGDVQSIPNISGGQRRWLVWIAYRGDALLDEIKIIASDSNGRTVANLSEPAQLEWVAGLRSGQQGADWVRRLSDVQQDMLTGTGWRCSCCRSAYSPMSCCSR